MKKTLLIVALALCTLSCDRMDKMAGDVSASFLEAYYGREYGKAAGFCTPELAEWIGRAAEREESLPDALLEKMRESAAGTTFRIISVERDSVPGKVTVRYELSAPGLERAVSKRLFLKIEGRTALVCGL